MTTQENQLAVNSAAIEKEFPMTSNIHRVRRTGHLLFGISVLAAIALTINVSATVRYVDLNSTNAAPPFTNWAAAATSIQDAIDAADAGDEILVTNGVYQTGGRVVSGEITNRVAVTKPVTVRSVNGSGVTMIQGYQLPGTINGDSAVRCVYLTSGATVIGFTLTNGATRSSGDQTLEESGGGVWCESTNAVLSNCVLISNSAYNYGGGALNGTLNNCTLTGNSAPDGGGGGASECMLNNCTLTSNSAAFGGGAEWCDLTDCTVTGNSAVSFDYGEGGGTYNSTLTKCKLSANSAVVAGGGAYLGTLNNCTLTGNATTYGGDTTGYGGGGAADSILNNCVLTGNTAAPGAGGGGGGAYACTLRNCVVYYNSGQNYSAGTLNYCCTTPFPESGTGNFPDAPFFVNLAGGDLRLQRNSPCVNAGNNAYAVGGTDLAGRPRIVAETVDVGAYEYQGPYTLTALTDGGGSVASSPPTGVNFSNLQEVVTATSAPGWTLLQWLGDAAGTNPIVNLSMTRNKTVRAVFGTTLSTTVAGSGSIVSSPLSPWYPYGNQVRLTAVPVTGNYLVFWANAAAGLTNNPLTFTITNANPILTAVFASLGGTQTGALTVIPDGRGQVTLTPPGNRFPLSTNVVLQVTPDAGQMFLGWSGDASGTANPLLVTVDSNKVVTASFTKRPWLSGEGNPDLLSQDGFRLTLSGEFGAAYEIFGSTDWSGWTLLGTVTNSWGTVQFTDAEAATNAHRFYRALTE